MEAKCKKETAYLKRALAEKEKENVRLKNELFSGGSQMILGNAKKSNQVGHQEFLRQELE